MSDEPIATIEDFEVRLNKEITGSGEEDRVEALLGDASSAVRSVTGRPFGDVTVTRRVHVIDGIAHLAERDISDVTAVKTVDGTDIGVSWNGGHRVYVGAVDLLQYDLEAAESDTVDVTYVRSGRPAPQWVVAMVVQMAARAYGRPADQMGVQQEAIAGYSYSVGSAAAAGAIGLLPDELKRLKEAFPKGGSTAWLGLRS